MAGSKHLIRAATAVKYRLLHHATISFIIDTNIALYCHPQEVAFNQSCGINVKLIFIYFGNTTLDYASPSSQD